MTSRRDTLRERWTEPPSDSPADSNVTDPGLAPPPDTAVASEASASPRNRSESEPIEVIFKKIAQQPHAVPRSVEPGESYQAVHAPAPARAMVHEPLVALNITTDPATPIARADTVAETLVVPQRTSRRGLFALLACVVVAAGLTALLLARSSTHVAGSAGAAAPSLPPSAPSMAPPTPLSVLPTASVAPAAASSTPISATASSSGPTSILPSAPVRPVTPARNAKRGGLETAEDPAGP